MILISSCLLGLPARYNGVIATFEHPVLERWVTQGLVVPVCPEVLGGLPIPRPPAEIGSGLGGKLVLQGQAQIFSSKGENVTEPFVRGARLTVDLARKHGIHVAILKQGSPSCGSSHISNGTFQGVRIPGMGVTTAALREAGILVFSEDQIDEAAQCLDRFGNDAP